MNPLANRPLALAIAITLVGIVMALVASGGPDSGSSVAAPEATLLPSESAPGSDAPTLFEEEGGSATDNDFIFVAVPLVIFSVLILVSVVARKRSRGPFG